MVLGVLVDVLAGVGTGILFAAGVRLDWFVLFDGCGAVPDVFEADPVVVFVDD